ncbi:MAG TPA: DUF3305 domain-containing protein [Pseudolabrys sp.]|nr:DUF3305 domain-containing protein [Pseudolabrys sp.]
MSAAAPLAKLSVGVLVERSKGASQWVDYLWRPVGILAGAPETPAWTKLSDDGTRAQYYAGATEVELYRSETGNYRDNLASGEPSLWVVLRRVEGDPPFELFMVTADPAEGEGMTEAGNDVVEMVPMPPPVQDAIAQFIAEYHVERAFTKRQRDRAPLEPLARRAPSTERR